MLTWGARIAAGRIGNYALRRERNQGLPPIVVSDQCVNVVRTGNVAVVRE